MLAHHEIFQLKYYGEASGVDPNVRDRFKHEPHYAACVRFCEKYDQVSFDPKFKSLPLSFFEPMVERIFARDTFWDYDNHPKKGAVISGKTQ